MAFMTYINPIFTYGAARFLQNCQAVGIDALIVPDMPYEEKQELLPFCQEHDVRLISMIAPTSNQRIQTIASEAEGFLYCVSSMGVTGVRQELGNHVAAMIQTAKEAKEIPCAIGFGISTPQQAAAMAAISDGAIVGSAIVKIVAQHGQECVPHVAKYVREMVQAVKAVQ